MEVKGKPAGTVYPSGDFRSDEPHAIGLNQFFDADLYRASAFTVAIQRSDQVLPQHSFEFFLFVGNVGIHSPSDILTEFDCVYVRCLAGWRFDGMVFVQPRYGELLA